VVVVDDNLPSAQLVQALLGRAGMHTVRVLTDPRVLLDRYEEMTPDLVLLDLHMPGVDGYTVLTELRDRTTAADLPVLVLTADTTREATHRALALGANDFLTKPLDAAELVLRVRNLLQARALHVGLRHRHRWMEASAQLARELLSGKCTEPLGRICELACTAADADLVVLAIPKDELMSDATPEVRFGDDAVATDELVMRAFAAKVIRADEARLLDDLTGACGEPAAPGAAGPTMVVPLVGMDRLLGTLVLCRSSGRPAFTETELDLAGGAANQAAMAVEYAQARADQERMLVLTDRHRIARDLHDQVIQRLFATGLRLQQLASRLAPGPVAERLDEQVGDLDDTITEIRSTIFGLRHHMSRGPNRLAERLRRLSAELTEVLGFEPDMHLDQSLDGVPNELADDLVAAAREAMTNIARHASASSAEVLVAVTDTDVILEVLDDGVGIGDALRRSGLTNLCERARRHGGSCSVGDGPSGGTHVAWTAPLAKDDAQLSAVSG
jgi:signal transduction histidine kinase